MINESKVKILSKLAGFEKKHYASAKDIEKITKGKIVARGVFRTIVMTSVAFIIILVLYSAYKGSVTENFQSFLGGSFEKFLNPYLWICYGVFELFYLVIALVFYTGKYKKMEKELEEYRRRRTNYNEFYGREDK